MNTTMKVAVAFAAGLGVGVGAGYLICKEKFAEECEKEIKAIREVYMSDDEEEEPVKTTRKAHIKFLLEQLEELEYDPEEDLDEDEDEEEYFEEVNPVDDEDEEEEDEEEEEDDESPSESPEGVEEVEKNVFYGDDYEDYGESCITLYTDGILTDDVEDQVDATTFFGDIDLQSYEPGDVLYFVNHTAMLRIELTVSKQSYKRDILGEEDDDEELGDMAD